MNIDSIKNGLVIDHIHAGGAMRLYNLLGLDELDCTVAIIKNAQSGKLGRKDIIKIDTVTDIDLDVLGYVDPGITVNVIRGGELVEKKQLSLPVWQAGPAFLTCATSASPSQSAVRETSVCTLPLVSPLRQRHWRLRL